MNVSILSANRFGYEITKAIRELKSIEIDAIITLSKKSNTKMYDGIENEKWHNFSIPVYEIKRINKEKKLIKSLDSELIVMCGWRQKVNKEIIEIPDKGIINFHPTLLPKGRGPAPIINTILNGCDRSGVTLYYLSEGLDDGDIIGQKEFPIKRNDHANDVYEKVIETGKDLIEEYLPLIAQNKAPRNPQDESKATYFDKPSLKDNKINLKGESIEEIFRKIKALSKPYEGAYIEKDNKKLILWEAELKDEEN